VAGRSATTFTVAAMAAVECFPIIPREGTYRMVLHLAYSILYLVPIVFRKWFPTLRENQGTGGAQGEFNERH